MKDLRMEQKQAKAYVEQNLKIAVIMTGSAFRFPAMNGLDQDVAGLVAGTLRNFPEDSAEAVNLFYLLEHDQCPVQVTKASDSREQYKHAHAIEKALSGYSTLLKTWKCPYELGESGTSGRIQTVFISETSL